MGTGIFFIRLLIILFIAATTSSIDSEQISSRQRGYGLLKFDGQHLAKDEQQHGGLISFQDQGYQGVQPFRFKKTQNYQKDSNTQSSIGFDNHQNKPITFEQANTYPEDGISNVNTGVTFQDDNRIEEQKGQTKKKRKKRRRPRLQQLPPSGAYLGGFPASGPVFPEFNGYTRPGTSFPSPGYGYPAAYGQNPYRNPAFAAELYRPPRRPKPPSVAAETFSAVTGALASIARYDDYQCVPRLLCEAAGGGGALGGVVPGTGAGTGLLQSVAGLQPLLNLLSAYNGISASPLFIFGRAVFLGMTSRVAPGSSGASATCRYAYPLCPTDPEQLVHYLNNHNGGFFRFFNAPQRPDPQYGLQQNLQQFYNQLAFPGHNAEQYGFYQPAEQLGSSLEHNGFQYEQLSYPPHGEASNCGLYNGNPNQQYYPNYERPIKNGYRNYGANYTYKNQQNYGFAKVALKNNESELKRVETDKIEKRIRNVKSEQFAEEYFSSYIVDRNKNSKWLFPNINHNENYAHSNEYTKRENKQFAFPKENFKTVHSDLNRKAKGFYFPGTQSYRDLDGNVCDESVHSDAALNSFQHEAQTESPQNEREEEVEIVYIVRGDGDPKNPEIVKLGPGRTIQTIRYPN